MEKINANPSLHKAYLNVRENMFSNQEKIEKLLLCKFFSLAGQTPMPSDRGGGGKARHPRRLCCHLLPIHPASISPSPRADRGCSGSCFLSPAENASCKRKLDVPRGQPAASTRLPDSYFA